MTQRWGSHRYLLGLQGTSSAWTRSPPSELNSRHALLSSTTRALRLRSGTLLAKNGIVTTLTSFSTVLYFPIPTCFAYVAMLLLDAVESVIETVIVTTFPA